MVKVIAGTLHQVTGPVIDIIAEPLFIDVTLQPDVVFEHEVPEKNLIFAYVFAGEGIFAPDTPPTKNRTCIRFEDGNKIQITASHSGVRFLLIGGKPILEPIAWRGPIVMNTNEEIRIAFDEYAKGTFIHT
jgi:hypothetical protein